MALVCEDISLMMKHSLIHISRETHGYIVRNRNINQQTANVSFNDPHLSMIYSSNGRVLGANIYTCLITRATLAVELQSIIHKTYD